MPINPHRNEVEVVPGVIATPTFDAICRIEEVLGLGIYEILQNSAQKKPLTVTQSSHVIRICVAANGGSVSKDMGSFMTPIIQKIGVRGIIAKATEILVQAATTGEELTDDGADPSKMETK